MRRTHALLDQSKLDRARKLLGARTETQTLDRALDLIIAAAGTDAALRRARGRAKIRSLFR